VAASGANPRGKGSMIPEPVEWQDQSDGTALSEPDVAATERGASSGLVCGR